MSEVAFARSGDVHIAYRVVGDGPVDLVYGDIRGIAAHIGARVAAAAGPDEVLVSSSVRDLVAGSGFAFVDRGMHALKGVEEERRLYAVTA